MKYDWDVPLSVGALLIAFGMLLFALDRVGERALQKELWACTTTISKTHVGRVGG